MQRELDFGGSFGGPVVIPHLYNGHDKTFFFFAYEEYHNTQTLNQGTITVPTTAYRNGDLSSLLLGPIVDSNGAPVLDCLGRPMINGAVYNPATTRTATCTDGSTAVVRDPFPNNFIGAPTTWDPVAQKVLPYIPTPSGATANQLTNNYPNLQPNNKYQYLTSIKIDHSIGETWHFSGYYIAEQSNKDNAADGINGTAAQTRWNTTPAPQVYLNADYTATPRLVLHAGFDFTRHDAAQDSCGAELRFVDSWVEHVGKYAWRRRENLPDHQRTHNQPSGRSSAGNQQRSVYRRQLGSHWIRDLGPRRSYVQIWRRSPSSGIWHAQRPVGRILRLRYQSDVSAVRQGPKSFMEPASATVSRASLWANWVAQVSGTTTFNGFTA